MRTLLNACHAVQALAHNPYNYEDTFDGDPIDVSMYGNDFRDVLFVLWTDSVEDGNFTFTVQDYNPVTDEYEDVDDAYILGTVPTLDGSSAENACWQFGYKPYGRQFVRIRMTSENIDDGARFGVIALLGNGSQSPPNRS